MLTKRSERMREYFKNKVIPENLWLGVTVDNKKHGVSRLKDLQSINTKNKHICCEPLLEDPGDVDLAGLRLVVAGGQSGNKARKVELSWVESLQRQCQIQNVHFYGKSWGSHDQDGVFKENGKSGCFINGKEYLSFPGNIMP